MYRPGKRSQWLCAKCECRDQDGGTSPVERKPRAKRTLRHTTRLAPLPSTSKVRDNQTPVADVHQTHSVQRSGRWDQPRRAQAPCGMTSNQSHINTLYFDPCAEISNLPILLKVWHWTYFVLSFASSFMEGSHINTKLSDLHHWLRYPRLARFGTTRPLSLTYTLCMSGTRSRRTRLT